MLPLVLMFVVLYFVMIRPQMKRQKEHKAMVEALAKGDEVVTAGGVLGKVAKLGETYVHVEIANGVEIQVQRARRRAGAAQGHASSKPRRAVPQAALRRAGSPSRRATAPRRNPMNRYPALEVRDPR